MGIGRFAGAAWGALGVGLLLLAGCGGGGGGGTGVPGNAGGGGASSPVFRATPAPATLQAESLEGYGTTVSLQAAISYDSEQALWLAIGYDPAHALDVDGYVSGDTLYGTLTLRGDLVPGVYTSSVSLIACLDVDCKTQAKGSPVSVPLRFEVTPNLQVQPTVTLQRSGRDAAPSATVPVTVPSRAGAVTMTHNAYGDAFDITFDGQTLQVQTRQVRAGNYQAQVQLQGANDPRYHRTVTLQYTVDPPPGGEQALSVSPNILYAYLGQGAAQTYRFKATRPTWTDAWDAPRVCDGGDLVQLRDLGNDEFEIALSAFGRPTGSYAGALCFSAGTLGGSVGVSIYLSVDAPFYPTANLNLELDAGSGAAALTASSPVLTADGAPQQWTAVSRTPWLTLLRSGGITGADALAMQVDPAFDGQDVVDHVATVELAIDRPGTLPMVVPVGVRNLLPALERSNATLVGSQGRLYVEGFLANGQGQLLPTLRLDGATLKQAQLLADTRFVGDVSVLAVDVEGATAGQTLTLRSTTPLKQTQVSVAVEAPTRVPAGYLALPFGRYRPPQYAAGADALYFAGADTVYRWSHAGGSWALSQAGAAGLIDVALRPDEKRLYATRGAAVEALDPVSLQLLDAGALGTSPFDSGRAFDPAVPAGQRGLAFAADGRAIASLVTWSQGQRQDRAAFWIDGTRTTRALAELTQNPARQDPGSGYWSLDAPEIGVGLVASANGRSIAGTDGGGTVWMYRPDQRQWVAGPRLPAGTRAVAVSDDGQRLVRNDGVVVQGAELGSLAGLVPTGHVAAGYGLSQNGRYGLVYSYRVALENGAERARDAAVRVFDLQNGAPVAAAPLAATLPLADAVGCLGVTVAAETCAHEASVTLAPGDGSVFVLGPRGLAALPMPDAMVAAAVKKRPLRQLGPRPATARQ